MKDIVQSINEYFPSFRKASITRYRRDKQPLELLFFMGCIDGVHVIIRAHLNDENEPITYAILLPSVITTFNASATYAPIGVEIRSTITGMWETLL